MLRSTDTPRTPAPAADAPRRDPAAVRFQLPRVVETHRHGWVRPAAGRAPAESRGGGVW